MIWSALLLSELRVRGEMQFDGLHCIAGVLEGIESIVLSYLCNMFHHLTLNRWCSIVPSEDPVLSPLSALCAPLRQVRRFLWAVV